VRTRRDRRIDIAPAGTGGAVGREGRPDIRIANPARPQIVGPPERCETIRRAVIWKANRRAAAEAFVATRP